MLLSPLEFGRQVPTASAYESAFRAVERELPRNALPMLRAHYTAPQHTLTATEMAAAMGYAHYGSANLHYGKVGSMICGELNLHLQYAVNVFAYFTKPGTDNKNEHWLWVMWPQVVEALQQLDWGGQDLTTV